MELEYEEWCTIYKDIENIANDYFNKAINQVYDRDILINFEIDKVPEAYKEIAKAYSERLAKDEYLIKFSTGMLNRLMDHAISLSDDNNFIKLLGLSTNFSPEKMEKLQFLLFFIYIDIILCHEWSHIFCGHVDLKSDSINWNRIDESVLRSMELEADSKGITLTLPRFSNNYSNLEANLSQLKGQNYITNTEVWQIYTYSVISLFEFLEETPSTIKTHPKPSYRVFTTLMSIAGILSEKPEVRKNLNAMSNDKETIYSFFGDLIIRYYTKYKGLDYTDLLEVQNEAYSYCSEVGNIIRVTNLSKYRLINS